MLLICDAIMIGYRKSTKDGLVVSFAIHPNDMPDELAIADLGSQWRMQLVPLDEHGNPDTDRVEPPPARSVRGVGGAQPRKLPAAAPAPRTFNLANHIGMLCANNRFHRFLEDDFPDRWSFLNNGTPDKKAAEIVRSLCDVSSRAHIESNPNAYNKWQQVVARYHNWQRNVPF
jgi:hypothetical protein